MEGIEKLMFKKTAASAAILVAGFAAGGAWQAQAGPAAAPAAPSSSAAQAVTGIEAATQPFQAHAVLPYAGSYMGHDQYFRTVRFHFSGNQMTHFTVNGQSFGGAHVSGHHWPETCSNGRCTKGTWSDDVTVQGQWRDQNGHVSHFTAHLFAH